MFTTTKKNILVISAVTAVFGVTGCDLSDTDSSDTTSNFSDRVRLERSADGFTIYWSKNDNDYAEIIYTDDLDKKRGNGYPLTANKAGEYTLVCSESSKSSDSVRYRCKASNVTYTKSITFKIDKSYMWLPSYGVEHTHGEIFATMRYDGESVTIE
jgi:hypothetical protein